jgi:uncharacterized 2Fe-2S/4Fe-4S cluster protein (DUF4445 family)
MAADSVHITIRFAPVGKRVSFSQPPTILEAARQAGVGLLSLCGGLGSCGRCRVQIEEGQFSPLTDTERQVLSAEELFKGFRLACHTTVLSDAVVYIPPGTRVQEQRLQLDGTESAVSLDPPVHKLRLDLPPATANDTRSNWTRLEDVMRTAHGVRLRSPDPAVLREVGPALVRGQWHVTLSLRGSELIHIEPGDTTRRQFGVAVDLGSTKIAVYLVDLTTGRTIEARGTPNPQIAYGEDVISRIHHTMTHADGTWQLQSSAVQAINETVATLCAMHSMAPSEILEVSLVGNTAMHHLFLGLPTSQLALAPYVASVVHALHVKAQQVGLVTAPGAYIYLPPAVAGFVGSDHVAMALASWVPQNGTHLRIDIGTNTEMSLTHAGQISAVSCASGPAFEGASIQCGMKAAPGAIERVWIDPDTQEIHLTTIGEGAPVGLCGSGILDCVAGMYGAGMLNRRGVIQPSCKGIRAGRDSLLELVLASGENVQDLTVTQRDVERIQLAKGAIRSGIEVLLDAAHLTAADLDQIILAGAFGTYIDPLSALQIGMLPRVAPDRIVQVGNAAGVGAKQMLISIAKRKEAEALARQINYIELTVYPMYSRFFAHAMRF